MQVPIFAPNISGMPDSSVMDPLLARVMTMPVVALLLWISAVNTAPAIIPRNGFSKLVRMMLKVRMSWQLNIIFRLQVFILIYVLEQ